MNPSEITKLYGPETTTVSLGSMPVDKKKDVKLILDNLLTLQYLENIEIALTGEDGEGFGDVSEEVKQFLEKKEFDFNDCELVLSPFGTRERNFKKNFSEGINIEIFTKVKLR